MFVYTSNEQSRKEIKKTIPFTVSLKRIKYLVRNLTKKEQVLYTENYITSFQEI